ncbi:Pentatricopeptide repeat-containing protein [Thalictrum thalictroides]|uniref:Pentatricopeptide repeat-containing protein n=1 Tax=Thalictrum thalictroides TaxID=46969 RepID=A0A7J6WNH8_THATH|nr:Pentatricopeptide repeat-containing protein [Thalictrum thalictroides]
MKVTELGFLRRLVVFEKKSFFRVFNTTATLVNIVDEEQHFDSSPLVFNSETDEIKKRDYSLNCSANSKLHPLVSRVFHSLSWKVAREVRFSEAVCEYGFTHSIHIFGFIVHIFSSAGMHREVNCLLNDIVLYSKEIDYELYKLFPTLLDLSNGVKASMAVFSILIKVFARSSMLEDACNVFIQAKDNGLEVDVFSCNFLLTCLVEENKVEFVTNLFDAMKHLGPQPNVYTYTILMNFYCREDIGCVRKQLCRATEILEEMSRCGISPTVVTYGTYVKGLCGVGDVDRALKFLRDLRQRNQLPNSNCYNAVVSGLCRRGDVYEAVTVLEEMKSSGVSPDVHSYSILINGFFDGYCKSGQMDAARLICDEMNEMGTSPNLMTYTALMSGYCRHGSPQKALQLYDEMQEKGIKPDGITDLVLKSVLDKDNIQGCSKL